MSLYDTYQSEKDRTGLDTAGFAAPTGLYAQYQQEKGLTSPAPTPAPAPAPSQPSLFQKVMGFLNPSQQYPLSLYDQVNYKPPFSPVQSLKEVATSAFQGAKSAIAPTPQTAPEIFAAEKKAVGGGVSDLLGMWQSAINQTTDALTNVKNESPLDYATKLGGAGLTGIGAFFQPISIALNAVQATGFPIASQLANGVNALFAGIGSGSADAAHQALQASSLSPETKTKLEPIVQQAGALAGQILAGYGGAKVTDFAGLVKTIGDHVAVDLKGLDVVKTPLYAQFEAAKPAETAPTVKPPATAQEAASRYLTEVIQPNLDTGITIGADNLKDYFGNDYNTERHPIYSKASYDYLFPEALKIDQNPDVILTGGGPGSGKTEILIKTLRENGFKGIIYDSNASNEAGVVKQIEAIKAAGKKPIIVGVIPDVARSADFALTRTRKVTPEAFSNGHAGFPTVAEALIRKGALPPEDVNLVDTRSLDELSAKQKVAAGAYAQDPLALLNEVRYTKEDVQQLYTDKALRRKSGAQEPANAGERTFLPKTDQGLTEWQRAGFATKKEYQAALKDIAGNSESDLSNVVSDIIGGRLTFKPDPVVASEWKAALGSRYYKVFKKGATMSLDAKASELGFDSADDILNAVSEEVYNRYNDKLSARGASVPEAPQESLSLELGAGINPHIDNFIAQDVKPAFKGVTGSVAKTFDFIRKVFNPTARGEVAQQTGAIMREALAKMARDKEMVYQSLQKAHRIFDGYTKQQSLDFIDKLETGEEITGAEQFTSTMRDALGTRWKQIQEIKGTDAYIENYFPHIWKDPAKATEILTGFGKRPLEGTKTYLKHRTIPTIKEGVKLGLEPQSYNPVDLIMARISDMDRFLMANDVWTQFKDQGLRKFVRTGGEVPTGWVKINDKIANSFQFSPEEKGLILRGGWYMPEQAAAVVNNYLSPGLTNNPIYNAFRMMGNMLNQVQLGVSGYHALFTSADAVISKAALELQKGTISGIFKALTSPVSAPYYLWKNLTRGNALLNDYYSKNPQMPDMVDALERAGGRVRMDSFYNNDAIGNFMKAIRSENPVGAFFRFPGAAIEMAAKPIMQQLVPRQKLGVFADGAKFIMEKAAKEGWSEQKTTLRLQEMWDSVDNRMGQLVYDNLFWNKAIKDLGMASTRSLGWNLGTFRELGGGAAQFAKLPLQAATKSGRANIRLTPKMAYTLVLPYVVGMWGAAIYYAYNGKPPETLLDYFYPKTGKKLPNGNDERISLPSYMKDVFAYKTEGTQTIINKVHPEISTLVQMLQNKDYFGTEIRNADDPLVKQLEDIFAYQAKQFVPFTVTNLMQRQKTGGSFSDYLQSFAGITPAPGYITRTPLQSKISEMYDKRFGGGVKSQEQADISKQKSEVRTLYLTGKTEEANKGLDTLVSLGIVKDPKAFIREAEIPSDVKLFTQLPADDQISLIKTMELYQLQRYAWYVKKDVKAKFSTLSDNTKAFVDLVNSGEVKQPVWKKGIDTNSQ